MNFTRPSSYRMQPCCHLCAHVEQTIDIEEGPNYYCNVDGSTRPPCGSLQMEEEFDPWPWDKEKRHAASRTWDEWAIHREVEAHTVCDNYKKKGKGA